MNLMIMPAILGLGIFAVLASIVFWVWTIIDCIKSDLTPESKLIWLLIIVFFNIIGALIYWIFSDDVNESEFNFNKGSNERIARSSEDKILFGVCGGLARYFKIDSFVVRIITVVLILFAFRTMGVIFYLLVALIMPLDKDVKPLKKSSKISEKTKVKSSRKSTEKINKNSKAKKKRTALYVFGIIFGIMFILISIVVSGFIAYSFVRASNIDVFDNVAVEIKTEQISEKEVVAAIKSSYNYVQYQGDNLTLIEIREPSKDRCTIFNKDPYGLIVYDSGCKEYYHHFSVEKTSEIKGYAVTTLVVRGKIVEMNFNEILDKDKLN